MRTPSVFAAFCVAAFLLSSPASTAEDSRIAVVNVQGAVMETEDGIRAQATLKKLFDRRQQQLDGRQKELQRTRVDIEKQSRVLSREALQRRMEKWQREMVELQTIFVDYNKELQKKQDQLTAPIVQRMLGIIARVAKQRSFDAVMDKQAVPYIRPDLDLTDRVVQMYNAGEGPEPAPAAP